MIYTKADISGNKNPRLKLLVNGPFGSGKTYFGFTFPKVAYGMIEPNGILTAKSNPHLADNIEYAETFVPGEDADIKKTFERLAAFVKDAKERARRGEIETFFLDNLTHLAENRWIYINAYERAFGKTGNLDTQTMYGALHRWLYQFTVIDLISIPCHVVVSCHEMEEEKENDKGQLVPTGRIISNVLGGFRTKAAGLFNASLFLECKRTGENQYRHTARCRPSGGKDAKNNLGLPEIVENISYESIMTNLNKAPVAMVPVAPVAAPPAVPSIVPTEPVTK